MVRQYDKERSGPYRSRNGLVLGVCRGLAEHLDFSIFWMRILALFFLLSSVGIAIFVYFAFSFFGSTPKSRNVRAGSFFAL